MGDMVALGIHAGQEWTEVGELGLAFALSALIGFEREVRQKSAGLRTHTIVGLGAAMFMLISKYGFADVVSRGQVVLDPSRVAAQIVSGIGFIGGGLIFVRGDAVRGLTTAATVWLTAAVGAAAGAGLVFLALLCTAGHFIVVYGFTPLARRLPGSRHAPSRVRLSYAVGSGVLQQVLAACTRRGFLVTDLAVHGEGRGTQDSQRGRDRAPEDAAGPGPPGREADVVIEVVGGRAVADLVAELAAIPGMHSVTAGEADKTE
jgi:putative Mg2+ transporter-C (MgtC) family protein